MGTPVLLGNHNDCNIDKGRYVETDVSGYKAVVYVPSGIDNEQIQKTLILHSVKAAIWSLS